MNTDTPLPRCVIQHPLALPARVTLALEADGPILLAQLDAALARHPEVSAGDLRGLVIDRGRVHSEASEAAELAAGALLSADGKRIVAIGHRARLRQILTGDSVHILPTLLRPSAPGMLSVVFSFDGYTSIAVAKIATLRAQAVRCDPTRCSLDALLAGVLLGGPSSPPVLN